MSPLVAATLLASSASVCIANDPTTALDDIYREQAIQQQLNIGPTRDLPDRGWAIPAEYAWVLLGAAAAGALGLALWLAAFELGPIGQRRRRRQAQADSGPSVTDAGAPAPSDWLAAADDLARRGQFGEAIHLLSLGVLGTIRNSDGQASVAKTAREIARVHAGAHRERLRALVGVAELVHFGGRAATREQFEHCRRDAVEFDATTEPTTA